MGTLGLREANLAKVRGQVEGVGLESQGPHLLWIQASRGIMGPQTSLGAHLLWLGKHLCHLSLQRPGLGLLQAQNTVGHLLSPSPGFLSLENRALW